MNHLGGWPALCALVAVCANSTWATLTIETVTVGNPGNAADTRYESSGRGAVDYTYRIGKYEISAGQYTAFLNAVAAADPHSLYIEDMGRPEEYGCMIQRSGSSGNYTYSVAPDWADRPVNYMEWCDAARFANWLHNGQPIGPQGLNTTEDGSYFLNGAMTNAALAAVVREPDATWVIPSADEWHKAAYHKNDPGAPGANYFDYPTSSNDMPSNNLAVPDPGNNATFHAFPGDYTIGDPYYRTESGEHENSDSPYGTFDQGGNVWEWTEAKGTSISSRQMRGGSFCDHYSTLHAAECFNMYPTVEDISFGFRVAHVPEPAPIVMLALAGAAVIRRTRSSTPASAP